MFRNRQSGSFFGRRSGELHLAVLIEQMRREGYELQVSQPEVIMRQENGVTIEPYEDLSIEVPSDIGKRDRRSRATAWRTPPHESHSFGRQYQRHAYGVFDSYPWRIGLKNVLLAKTRGTVIMHHVFHRYEPVDRGRDNGAHGSCGRL